MQGLYPRQVETKDVFAWFQQSVQLINRNFLNYLFSVLIFFGCLLAISQGIQLFAASAPALVLLLVFLFAGVFVFYFFIAALVVVSYCADHTESVTPSMVIQQFVSVQRAFLRMTISAVLLGLLYWYISVLMNPGSDISSMSEKTIALISKESSVVFYAFKVSAMFLYFLLIVKFFLRTFFSVPLIVFHGLSYQEAKMLSHNGIIKNIRPMSYVMLVWFIALSAATLFAPVLAIGLMPLFATFGYVAYRHIYLGQGENSVAVKQCSVSAPG